jgi:maleylacetoacetate isomerase
MRLYSYWRSQASYRVRIALRLKGMTPEIVSLDLMKGDQFAADYKARNPEAVVPTLIDGDGPPLMQSMAILEYLEEKYPRPPLLPTDPYARNHVRALAQMVVADAHPFLTPRVRKRLEGTYGFDEPKRIEWIRHWQDLATNTLEQVLSKDARTGRYCCGDALSFADLCLVPHVMTSKMLYQFDVSPYPTVKRIFDTCMQLEAFSATAPLMQPDAPKSA